MFGTSFFEGSKDNYCKSDTHMHTHTRARARTHTHTHNIVTVILGLRLTSERKFSKGCEDLGWFLVWVHAIAES